MTVRVTVVVTVESTVMVTVVFLSPP